MPFDLPQRRIPLKQIQTTKRNVPIDQIIATYGQSPVATGIETLGNVLGQSLARKAELRRQGEQLARLESLAGQKPGAFEGLDVPTAATFTNKLIADRSELYTPAQLAALNTGDPATISTAFPRGVPPNAATLAANISSREENRQLRKLQQEQMAAERRNKEKVDLVTKFNSDPGIRKIDTSIDAAATIRELATSGNPIAANAIPTYMARASGEVGNLSEADKAPFGGSASLLSRLNAALFQKAQGQLTPENQQFLVQLSDLMERRALENKDRRAREISSQYGQASDFLKQDEIYNTLRPIVPKAPIPITPKKVGRFQIEVGQ